MGRRGKERTVFEEDGSTRKVSEKNGASGPCQYLEPMSHVKESWEADLVGLSPGMANGGLSSKPQTETYG